MSRLEQSPLGIYSASEIRLLNEMAKDAVDGKSISNRMEELWQESVLPAFLDAGFQPDGNRAWHFHARSTLTLSRKIVDPLTHNSIRVEQSLEIPAMVEFRWVLRFRVTCCQNTNLAGATLSSIPSDGHQQQTIVQYLEDNSRLSPSAGFTDLAQAVVASLSRSLSA